MNLSSLVLGLALSHNSQALEIAQNAAEQEQAILELAAIAQLPLNEARRHFAAWVATQPYDWRICHRLIMAGNKEWLQ